MYILNLSTMKLDVTQGQFLRGVKLVWIQSFPPHVVVVWSRAKESNLPNYLVIGSGGTDGFMPFPRVFVQNETQTDLSSINWF